MPVPHEKTLNDRNEALRILAISPGEIAAIGALHLPLVPPFVARSAEAVRYPSQLPWTKIVVPPVACRASYCHVSLPLSIFSYFLEKALAFKGFGNDFGRKTREILLHGYHFSLLYQFLSSAFTKPNLPATSSYAASAFSNGRWIVPSRYGFVQKLLCAPRIPSCE